MAKFSVLLAAFALFQAASAGKLLDSLNKTPLIVGGERADISDFPHSLALLDLIRGGASGYICGASNIGRLWAMSAAHCLQSNTPPSMINLYGGSSSRISGGHLFFVSSYTLHPRYSRLTLDFDIALINVSPGSPLEGFANVTPIPLPPSCATNCCGVCPDGPDISVAGWGRIDNGSLPEFLMQVSKAIMGNPQCSSYWRTLTSRMFCTIIEDGRDSCNGDSGSAIVRSGIQVGVVSFGSNVCGDGSRPAVYVRVEEPEVRSWVTQISGL